jgi:hypothetical protein
VHFAEQSRASIVNEGTAYSIEMAAGVTVQHVAARTLSSVLPPCLRFLTTIASLAYKNQPLQKRSSRPTGKSH